MITINRHRYLAALHRILDDYAAHDVRDMALGEVDAQVKREAQRRGVLLACEQLLADKEE